MSILVCDDHEMFLSALVETLEAHGHDVVAATSDPAEVPRLVERLRPDLVLLDVQLPGISGIDLARQVRSLLPQAAVVLLTGSTEEPVRSAYDTRLVDGLVCKSSGVRVLESAIEQVLAGDTRPARTTPLDLLTQREREVLRLMADGATTAEMATLMGVSVNTVRTHVRNVLQKLGVRQRAKAAHAAVELGLAATA
ncbi:MAG: response regulator transcription factor [Nocardioidaceae bacterium]